MTSIRIPIGPQSSFVNYSNVMFFFHPSLEEAPGTTYSSLFPVTMLQCLMT